MLPVTLSALLTGANRPSIFLASVIIEISTLLIHAPLLEKLSEKFVPKCFVATWAHMEHHELYKVHFAAPTLNMDRFFERNMGERVRKMREDGMEPDLNEGKLLSVQRNVGERVWKMIKDGMELYKQADLNKVKLLAVKLLLWLFCCGRVMTYTISFKPFSSGEVEDKSSLALVISFLLCVLILVVSMAALLRIS